MWLIYAILCAFLVSAASIVQKKTLMKQHAMEFSATLALITMVLCIPFLFFIDYSVISMKALMIIYFATVLGSIAFLLVAKSIRHMELSEAAPLLVLGPGITAILAFIFLGENLTSLQILGIAMLILGSYILELKNHHDFFHPIRTIKKSKYYYFILIALALYSVSSIFDRLVLSRYDVEPMTYIAFAHVFLAINFLVMITLFHDGVKGIKHGLQNLGVWLLLAGMLTVGYRFAQMQAVKTTYVGLVLPVKRMSVFFTVMIGGGLFHEHNLKRKGFACMIMMAGVLMIII